MSSYRHNVKNLIVSKNHSIPKSIILTGILSNYVVLEPLKSHEKIIIKIIGNPQHLSF